MRRAASVAAIAALLLVPTAAAKFRITMHAPAKAKVLRLVVIAPGRLVVPNYGHDGYMSPLPAVRTVRVVP